jgi:hypothetical protein
VTIPLPALIALVLVLAWLIGAVLANTSTLKSMGRTLRAHEQRLGFHYDTACKAKQDMDGLRKCVGGTEETVGLLIQQVNNLGERIRIMRGLSCTTPPTAAATASDKPGVASEPPSPSPGGPPSCASPVARPRDGCAG